MKIIFRTICVFFILIFSIFLRYYIKPIYKFTYMNSSGQNALIDMNTSKIWINGISQNFINCTDEKNFCLKNPEFLIIAPKKCAKIPPKNSSFIFTAGKIRVVQFSIEPHGSLEDGLYVSMSDKNSAPFHYGNHQIDSLFINDGNLNLNYFVNSENYSVNILEKYEYKLKRSEGLFKCTE
jgi:hypothetical protein